MDPHDHYAVLGITGDDMMPMQRVMHCASMTTEQIKDAYRRVLPTAAGNPFTKAKLAQAFQVLSGDDRKMYDLELMKSAACVTRPDVVHKHILTALNFHFFNSNLYWGYRTAS